eukprot:CAMPEP_0196809188 /NCGR_PEP_ID=MMETSP1362-20130617/9150_1 /TAXON_ID=163516 /ORGANISM="Leptocylindrus danicus, Strain CCMP1856" /LENGTH=307 /DNA_ID=CAMNT_0042183791 /DNA_START=79 /DNA_END=1002 /DNA_ORIENTATION=+
MAWNRATGRGATASSGSVDEEEGFEDCIDIDMMQESTSTSQNINEKQEQRHQQQPRQSHTNTYNSGRITESFSISLSDDGDEEIDDNSTVSDKQEDTYPYAFFGAGGASSSFQSNTQQRVGVIIAFGKEQVCTPPALLLLCPFTAMFVTFAFLDLEKWNWRNCLTNRHVRRHCYGYQALGFSLLLLIGLQFYGDRIVLESLGDDQQTVASRLFQRQLAVLILTCGVGLFAIEDTLARETSIFATAFATFCIFTGTAHKAAGLPAVTWVPFLWNGAQLLLVAWLGGNLVDGEWTSEWKGNDSTGILDR